MFRLGLTGSIAMGKSTIAQIFRDFSIPVWDADACVHRLYQSDKPLQDAIIKAFGDVLGVEGIDRSKLSLALRSDRDGFSKLNGLVHPLVVKDRKNFEAEAEARAEPLMVADIPLLFETQAERSMDAVLVVSAPEAVQKARLMQREGMNLEKMQAILSQQMPDALKRQKATYILSTDQDIEACRSEVKALIERLCPPYEFKDILSE